MDALCTVFEGGSLPAIWVGNFYGHNLLGGSTSDGVGRTVEETMGRPVWGRCVYIMVVPQGCRGGGGGGSRSVFS